MELGALLSFRDYEANAVVCREGEEASELRILLRGAVVVSYNGKVLATLGSGALLGEMGVLTGTPHSCTVETTEPTQMLILGRENFKK